MGLLADLAGIAGRAVHHLDDAHRMTVLGALLLLAGAAVVFGAVHYKTHEEEWEARLVALRRYLREPE